MELNALPISVLIPYFLQMAICKKWYKYSEKILSFIFIIITLTFIILTYFSSTNIVDIKNVN